MSQLGDDPIDPRPQQPREPEAGECCQNGCDPCVYDRYWEALNRYEEALAEWESRHPEGQAAGEGVKTTH